MFFVAPADLAQTMGHIGNHTHPDVQATIDNALAQIIAAGRTAGTLATDDNVERYRDAGVRFFLTGWTNWVSQGAKAFLQRVRWAVRDSLMFIEKGRAEVSEEGAPCRQPDLLIFPAAQTAPAGAGRGIGVVT